MQHCVWFPWIAAYLWNRSRSASAAFLSCRWQIRLKLGGFERAHIPFNRFIHTVGSRNSVERLSGFVVFCWEDQSETLPFLCKMVLGNGSRNLDFSCMMESGSSKQRHLAPTRSKSGWLQLPKSSFNGWNHESRQSVFQIESMSPGSSWFFMPASNVLTAKKKQSKLFYFYIESRFPSYFLTNPLLKPACLPHPHTWTTGNPLKQWKFDSTDVSTAHSLFRSHTTEELFLLTYCRFCTFKLQTWWNERSWTNAVIVSPNEFDVRYCELRVRVSWSGLTEQATYKHHQSASIIHNQSI